jgi:hypothetical protein
MRSCAAISRTARHDDLGMLLSSCAVGGQDSRPRRVSSENTRLLFTKKLRARVKSGDVTASVRIWKTPRVKVGGHYRLDEGHIEVTSIREITWEDLDDHLARDTGFKNLIDMMKTAKHGSGSRVYFVRFEYRAGSERSVSTKRKTP